MLKELIKIANELDERGLHKEADACDEIAQHGTPTYLTHGLDAKRLAEEMLRECSEERREKERREQFIREVKGPKEQTHSSDADAMEADLDSRRTMMETAEDKDRERRIEEKRKEKRMWEEELEKTANWFNENVFIDKKDQWPLEVDKDYYYAFYSDERMMTNITGVIEKGSVYDNVLSAGAMNDSFNLPPLNKIYKILQQFVAKHNLNVPSLHS
jgi:hypothetical protein